MSDLTDKKRLSACIQMLRDGCLINAADQRFVADVIAALRPAQDAEGWVMVPVGHLKEAMRFYPPFDHDIKTRLIGNDLREIAAATAPRSEGGKKHTIQVDCLVCHDKGCIHCVPEDQRS
jgi:hypothetical protein